METETKTDEKTVDIDSMIDSVVSEKSDVSDDTKAEEMKDSPEKEAQEKKNDGWLTSIPKEFRDGIDTEKYDSLGAWLKSVVENQKEDPSVTKERLDKEWEDFFNESHNENDSEDDKKRWKDILDSLKNDGVNPSDARKTITRILDENKKVSDEKLEEIQKSYSEYIDMKWGNSKEANFKTVERGMRVVAGQSPEILKMARDGGFSKHPAFLEMCRMLGSQSSESSLGKGSPKTDNYNPLDPLGYRR